MDLLLRYAITLSGTPYIYGGSNPVGGFDCSGYVTWILKAGGIAPPGRLNSQELYDYFDRIATPNIVQAGSLAFYGKSAVTIEHIAFCIDPYRIMECGGGDHTTLTRQDAIDHNACVRMNLIDYRPDRVAILKPSYVKIGLV